MIKILILGSTGMLGNQITKVLSNRFTVIEANRTGIPVVTKNRSFKIDARNIESIINVFEKGDDFDYVLNCIGSIKQLISQSSQSVQNAIYLNALLPHALDELSKQHDFRVIQICTDCVFSGELGGSSENTPHDAIDIYGKTKSLGEVESKNTMNIRCSIVGKEINSSNSLLDWFLARPTNSKVVGYTNHFWNGVTTLHFSRVVQALILNNNFNPGTFHLIPADQISKHGLLSVFAEEYNRMDVEIEPIDMKIKVDRTLKTLHPELNNRMWSGAGYSSPPSIKNMINELRIQNETEKLYD